MRAIGQWVIVEEVKEEVRQDGFLLTDQDVKDLQYHRGRIMSSGEEVEGVKEGDEVYFQKAGSFAMIINGKRYSFFKKHNLIVII